MVSKDLVKIVLNTEDTKHWIDTLTNLIELTEKEISDGYLTKPSQDQAEYLELRKYELGRYQSLLKKITDFYDYRNRE